MIAHRAVGDSYCRELPPVLTCERRLSASEVRGLSHGGSKGVHVATKKIGLVNNALRLLWVSESELAPDAGTATPWILRNSDKILSGDIDGDGKDELIFVAEAAVAIVRRAQNPEPNRRLVVDWIDTEIPAREGNPPLLGWEIEEDDKWVAGRFDTSGRQQFLVIRNSGGRAGIMEEHGGRLLYHISVRNAGVEWAGDDRPAFSLHRSDTVIAASLEGGGAQQVVVQTHDHDLWVLGVFDGNHDSRQLKARFSRSSIPSIDGSIDPWNVSSSDRVIAADLDGDGKDELLLVSKQGRVGVVKLNPDDGPSDLRLIWSTASGVSGGVTGSGNRWNIYADDLFVEADVHGTGQPELHVIAHSSIGTLRFNQDGLRFFTMAHHNLIWAGAGTESDFDLANAKQLIRMPEAMGAGQPDRILLVFDHDLATLGYGGSIYSLGVMSGMVDKIDAVTEPGLDLDDWTINKKDKFVVANVGTVQDSTDPKATELIVINHQGGGGGNWFTDGVNAGLSVVNDIVDTVEKGLGDVFDAAATLFAAFLAIPILGRIIGAVHNFALELFWRAVGVVDFILSLFCVRFDKRLRICVVIMRDEQWQPVVGVEEMEEKVLDARRILKEQADIKLEYEIKNLPSDDITSEVVTPDCGAQLILDDIIGRGLWAAQDVRACFSGRFRNIIGYGGPITVFVVPKLSPSTKEGCASPHLNYLFVTSAANGIVLAHELGHAGFLFHRKNRANLMKKAPTFRENLTCWQSSVLRGSRHVTFF